LNANPIERWSAQELEKSLLEIRASILPSCSNFKRFLSRKSLPDRSPVEREAHKGNAKSQLKLGKWYEAGKTGLSKIDNLKQAARWYRLAAGQGDADAQNELGICYEKGLGVIKDIQKAITWYQLAVGQGHVAAQKNYSLSKGRITCYKRF